jgi:hypothetical protein
MSGINILRIAQLLSLEFHAPWPFNSAGESAATPTAFRDRSFHLRFGILAFNQTNGAKIDAVAKGGTIMDPRKAARTRSRVPPAALSAAV